MVMGVGATYAPMVGGPMMVQPQPWLMGQTGPQPLAMMAGPGIRPVAAVQPQQSFQNTPSVRIQPSQMFAPVGVPPPQQALHVQGQEPLTDIMLEATAPQEQIQDHQRKEDKK